MRIADIRTYAKFLSKNKLYTLVTILGFSVSLMFVLLLSIYVKSELSVDKFHKNKDRIYLMASSPENAAFANPVADLVKDNIPEVETFTRIVSRSMVIEDKKNKMSVETLFADSSFFNMFSFKLISGNPSKVLSLKKSAVVTQSFANKIYGNDDPVGKYLQINDSTSLLITGIMADFPKNTQLPRSEIVVNYQMIESFWMKGILAEWGNASFTMYFMARPNTDLPSKAQAIIDLFLKNDYWIYKQGYSKEVLFIPLEDVYFSGVSVYFSALRNNSLTLVSVYLIITILVLVVAILNYINLSVSQAGKRGKETAIKKLLGCNRKAVFSQFISETMAMTLVSFLLGVLLAFLVEPFFNNALNTQLDLKEQFSLGFTITTILMVLLIGFISGLVPAVAVSRFQPLEVVKGTYNLKVKSVYSKVLISFQYIVAICLLACSFFVIKQTFFMKSYDLGFKKDNILIIKNTLDGNRLPALRSALMNIPGVENVSLTSGTPLDGGNNNSFEYKGQALSFQYFQVDSAFFEIFDIKVSPTGSAHTKGVMWLNQKGYDVLQPDSISNTVQINDQWSIQVGGITENFHIRSLHTEVGPLMIAHRDEPTWYAWAVVVKINGNEPFKIAGEIERVYAQFSNGEPIEAQFADDTVQKWYISEDRTVKILSAFTILTFVILLMGIFAMSQYYVRQKEKEIGIRKVNGATEYEILQMLNISFVKWIAVAFVVSVPLVCFVMQQWLNNFPYKTELSWWIYAVTGAIVLVLSIVCISVRTWKAATANPVETLKNE